MIKKITISIFIILLVGIFLVPQYSSVNAKFYPDTYKPDSVGSNDKLKQKGNIIVGAIQAVGVVVSVAALTGIAIKYMLGSVEEKAEYKQTMIPYIIGASMLFVVSAFLQTLYNIAQSIE